MICPKCSSERVTIVDDSFDHGEGHHGCAGTHIAKYPVCSDCGYGEFYGEDDWDYEWDNESSEVKE